MKIVCEKCRAKYSIADDKVQGKVFKIRCKKCGTALLVKGLSAEAPSPLTNDQEGNELDAETRVFDYSGYQSSDREPAIWHIVVEGQQQGPYTDDQINHFLENGSLDPQSFIWKEGFENWKAIETVPELERPSIDRVALTNAEANVGLFDHPAGAEKGLFDEPLSGGIFGQEPAQGEGKLPPGSELFGNSAEPATAAPGSSLGDIFSSASSVTSPGGLFDADTTIEPESAGLFGNSARRSLRLLGEKDVLGVSTGPTSDLSHATALEPMTGQRNESSVLFSLSNLQALAETTTSENACGAAAAAIPLTASAAEASGLIDIRSLAVSINIDKNDTGVNDLIDALGGANFTPHAVPVLTPQRTKLSAPLQAVLTLAGVCVASLIVAIVVMIVHGNQGGSDKQLVEVELADLKKRLAQIQAAGGTAKQAETIQKQITAMEQDQEISRPSSVSGKNVDDRLSPDHANESDKNLQSEAGSSGRSGENRRERSSRDSQKRRSPEEATDGQNTQSSTAPIPQAPKKHSVADELDDLLGGSLSKPNIPDTAVTATSKTGQGSNGKTNLDRGDVQKGMNAIAAKVKACGHGQSGTVVLKVVIGNTGRVISAIATGPHAGTPVGSCAARAVRSARFPITDSNLTVRYPFHL